MDPTEIRRLRQCLALTQEQFASLLGLSFVSVNRWEQGHSSPTGLSPVLLQLLAEALKRHAPEAVVASLRIVGPEPIKIVPALVRLGEDKDVQP